MSRFADFLLLLALFAAALAFVSAPLSAATELRLRNGDVLRGEHLKTENGIIHFRSPVLGTMLVPAADAEVKDVPDTPVESLVGLPPVKATAKPNTDADKTPEGNAKPADDKNADNPHAAVATVAKPTAPSKAAAHVSKPKWKGKVEFGYQQQSGRKDAISGSLRIDAESATKSANLLKASARALYGKQNSQINSERYEGSFRWRHDFGARLFTQSLTSYLADRVKHIDQSYEQNIGLGYRIIDHGRHILNAGFGGTAQYRQALGVTEDVVYLTEFFQDYSYKINGRLSFTQESNALYSTKAILRDTSPAGNYRLRFNTALQGKISDRVSLNLRYEYEYDNTVANPALRADQRVTSSIGYAL
jgi:putative salt-induced outer membrane protein YdiY